MFGSNLRCPTCNKYIPDRCTCTKPVTPPPEQASDEPMRATIPTWQERLASVPGRYVDSECRAMAAEIADLRAALKAQPAPTEAPITFEDVQDAARLAWSVALDDAAFYVAGHCANGEFHAEAISAMRMPLIKFRGEVAPTEAQGIDVDRLIAEFGLEKVVAAARAELQTDPAIIPSLLAVQGEDSARLDAPTRWKLVPIEPTPEMCDAAGESLWGYTRAEAEAWAKVDKFESQAERGRDAYVAMLAVAPQPQEQS